MPDDSHIRRYRFHKPAGETAWDAVRRLSEEVGWDVAYPDAEIDRLRSHTAELGPVSRARMTRAEFVARLCADAGVTFRAPA